VCRKRRGKRERERERERMTEASFQLYAKPGRDLCQFALLEDPSVLCGE
jgi:hypothetical protein